MKRHAHNWKGGRVVDPRGYILIHQPEHPGADVRGRLLDGVEHSSFPEVA